jgi:hypothetical protein
MGNKTSTTKPAASVKRAAKTKPAAAEVAVPAPSAPKANGTKPKAAARPPKPAAAKLKKPGYSQDDVALRAYFIAERRQAAGLLGDAHTDWIEAERQLAAEVKRGAKRTAKKA